MTFHTRLQDDTGADRARLLALPIVRDCLAGRVTLGQYVAFLTQAYHHVRHTVPLLMACGSRLPARLDWLRAAVAEYITEEIGHEAWILDDLAACGAEVADIPGGEPAFATDVMVAYAYDLVQRRNPVAFFGMVHVLEGTSIALATQAADALQCALDLPDRAFTYLRSHGALDRQHVEFFAQLMARLEDPEDQLAVLAASKAFYRLYGDMLAGLPHAGSAGGPAPRAAAAAV